MDTNSLHCRIRHRGGYKSENRLAGAKQNDVLIEESAGEAFSLVLHNGGDDLIVVFPLIARRFITSRQGLFNHDWGYPIPPHGQLELSRWGDQIRGIELEFGVLPGRTMNEDPEDLARTIEILVFRKLPPSRAPWTIEKLRRAVAEQGSLFASGRVRCRSKKELARLIPQARSTPLAPSSPSPLSI